MVSEVTGSSAMVKRVYSVVVLDCLVEVADAVNDVEEPPVVALGPRERLVLSGEGGRLRGVRRGPDRAGAPGHQRQRVRLQRRSLQGKGKDTTPGGELIGRQTERAAC